MVITTINHSSTSSHRVLTCALTVYHKRAALISHDLSPESLSGFWDSFVINRVYEGYF